MTAEQTAARPAPPLPFLAPFAVYILHTLEELPGFAAWATRHFGEETTSTFAAYHVPLILLVGFCSWRAMLSPGRGGVWVVLTTAFQWQFAVNALFHLTTWAVLGEYSPGAVTAATVSIPATGFYLAWIRRTGGRRGGSCCLRLGSGRWLRRGRSGSCSCRAGWWPGCLGVAGLQLVQRPGAEVPVGGGLPLTGGFSANRNHPGMPSTALHTPIAVARISPRTP